MPSATPSALPSASIHEQAIVESKSIGNDTRIWAFAHVLPGAIIGQACNICDGVFIENDVVVGDRVTIKCGVQLWDGVRLGDDVFVGPNATFTNDPFPRSGDQPESFAITKVDAGASIGANATILPGIHIGSKAMIGAGAVVTSDVPPRAIVVGNPGRIVGYAQTPVAEPEPNDSISADKPHATRVPGVAIHELPSFRDLRGSLTATEFVNDLPFVPKRSFLVYGVPGKEIRGEHAHRACEQFLMCVHGSVHVVVDDGTNREEHILDRASRGLYVPPMVWATEYRYTADSVLLVFASHEYDPGDYIREYDAFIKLVNPQGS